MGFGTVVQILGDDQIVGQVTIGDLEDAKTLVKILETNGYAVNLRGASSKQKGA